MAQRVGTSVATIRALDAGGEEIQQGTGFLVAPQVLLTCRHVVEGARKIVVLVGSEQQEVPVLGVVDMPDTEDLIGLVLGPRVKERPALTLSRRAIRQGDKILVLGSPLGLHGTLTVGYVSALRIDLAATTTIQISAQISGGSSGSPICDASGAVVGIVSSRIAGGEGLAFGMKASERMFQVSARDAVKLRDWLSRSAETVPREEGQQRGASQWTEYRNARHGFTIKFPSTWTVSDGVSADTIVKAVDPDGRGGPRMIVVSFMDVGLEVDLEQVEPKELVAAMSEGTTNADVEMLACGRETFGDRPVVWSKTRTVHPSYGRSSMQTWFLTKGNVLFWVTCVADERRQPDAGQSALFETAARSLRFVESSDKSDRAGNESDAHPDSALLSFDGAIQRESGLSESDGKLALTRFIVSRRSAHMQFMHKIGIADADAMLFYLTRVVDSARRKYPVAYVDLLMRSDEEIGGLPSERRYEMALALLPPEEVDLTKSYSGATGKAPQWLILGSSPPWTSMDRETRKRWKLDEALPPEVR